MPSSSSQKLWRTAYNTLDKDHTMQITMSNSSLNNSVFLEKRNKVDETWRADQRSMIKTSFRTFDPSSKKCRVRNPRWNLQLICDPTYEIRNKLNLFQKSTIHALFKAKSAVDPQIYKLSELGKRFNFVRQKFSTVHSSLAKLGTVANSAKRAK